MRPIRRLKRKREQRRRRRAPFFAEVYRGEDGLWWHRCRAANGEPVAGSVEGLESESYARHIARRVYRVLEVRTIGG
jgi:hypothetical protein